MVQQLPVTSASFSAPFTSSILSVSFYGAEDNELLVYRKRKQAMNDPRCSWKREFPSASTQQKKEERKKTWALENIVSNLQKHQQMIQLTHACVFLPFGTSVVHTCVSVYKRAAMLVQDTN